ncbi:MAG: PDC sensor domain-containing protein, partial [Spirochaetales bacterium]|nr:PDC sensor domain-containing protein [Spirochaetales bacterium]
AGFLDDVLKKEPSIQFAAMTDPSGKRIGQVHTQRGEGGLFRNARNKDFTGREWLAKVVESKEPWYSDLYFSKYTDRLILTAAQPIVNGEENIYAVLDLDFMFDELVKLESEVAEELFDSSFSY